MALGVLVSVDTAVEETGLWLTFPWRSRRTALRHRSGPAAQPVVCASGQRSLSGGLLHVPGGAARGGAAVLHRGRFLLGLLMHYLLFLEGSRNGALVIGLTSQLVLLGTTYLQMVATSEPVYFTVLFFQSLAVLGYGVVIRSRSLVIAPIAFATLGVATVVYGVLRGMSLVILIGCTGILLILLGSTALFCASASVRGGAAWGSGMREANHDRVGPGLIGNGKSGWHTWWRVDDGTSLHGSNQGPFHRRPDDENLSNARAHLQPPGREAIEAVAQTPCANVKQGTLARAEFAPRGQLRPLVGLEEERRMTTELTVTTSAIERAIPPTLIAVILDESGSMGRAWDEVIAEFNRFLEDQWALPDSCRLSLTKFNTLCSLVCPPTPVAHVPPPQPGSLYPRRQHGVIGEDRRNGEDGAATPGPG